jgi:autotransporter-associated beta strand protein
VLSGANTFSNQMQINNGRVHVNSIENAGVASSLGTGLLSPIIRLGTTTSTGRLLYTGTAIGETDRQIQIGNGNMSTHDGGSAIENNSLSPSHTMVFDNPDFNNPDSAATSQRTLTLGGSNTGDNLISGVIANNNTEGGGTVQVVKEGTGTWVLSGANTYTGNTVVRNGILKLGANNVIPGVLQASGLSASTVVDLNGFSDTVSSITLGGGGTSVAGLTNQIINTGGGSPSLTLGGTLNNAVGNPGFENGQATVAVNLVFNGNRTIAANDSPNATIDILVSGNISETGGARNLVKNGLGILALSGTNTYSGTTNVNDGVLVIGNGGTSGSLNPAGAIAIAANAVLAFNQTDTVTQGTDFSSSAITGAGMLAQGGSGTLVLNAANSYSGSTTVNSGSLQVGVASTGQTGTGAVNVVSGATLLGTGTVAGTSFTAASGASTHVGDSTAVDTLGQLNFTPATGTGEIDFEAGSTIFLGVGPGTTSDLLSFTGTGTTPLTFDGNMTVSATSGFSPSGLGPIVFNLLSWASLASSPTFNSRYSASSYGGYLFGNGDDNLGFDLPDVFSTGYAWDISSFTSNGSIALVNVIPEPSRAMLMLGGLILLAIRRKRPVSA